MEEVAVTRVAVIGLGTMGGRAAAALVSAGHSVTGHDPSPDALRAAADDGVEVAGSVTGAVREAELVLVSVPLPEHVRTVVEDLATTARPGTAVVDLSTVDPGTARQAAARLASHDVEYADAPVLGRPAGCGAWTLVVGGSPAFVERVAPLLGGSIAKAVVRVGDVGAGSVVKLANNLMFGAINAVTAEAVALCEAQGVDPAVFAATVADSGAATVSPLFRDIAPRMVSGDYDPVFALELLAKDNRLALELATDSGVEAPLAETVHRVNDVGMARQLAALDSAAVREVYRGPA